MTFTVEIKCDNAAFCDDEDDDRIPGDDADDDARGTEVARILHELAEHVEGGSTSRSLYDANGNKVGTAKFTD